MRYLPTATLLACLLSACNAPTAAPGGDEQAHSTAWPVVYQQRFADKEALSDFAFSDADAWAWHQRGGEHGMKLRGGSKYKPPHRSPLSIALLKGHSLARTDRLKVLLELREARAAARRRPEAPAATRRSASRRSRRRRGSGA